VSSILEQRIRGVQEEAGLAETGRVLSVGYVYTAAGKNECKGDAELRNTHCGHALRSKGKAWNGTE